MNKNHMFLNCTHKNGHESGDKEYDYSDGDLDAIMKLDKGELR